MAPQLLSMRITKIQNLTHDVRLFTLESEVELTWKSGQFCSILIEDGKEGKAFRAYSIATKGGTGNSFDLIIKLVPTGRGTPWIWTKKEGEIFQVLFPLGHFTLAAEQDRETLLIATGTGLAPMRGFAYELLEKGIQKPITLIFGVRHDEDLFLIEECEELERKYPNFRFITALSQPSDMWKGRSGRLNTILETEMISPQSEAYICGSGPMIESISSLLQEKGLQKERIHFERFM